MRFYIHFCFYYFKFKKIFIWLRRVLIEAHRMFYCSMQIVSCGMCDLVP